MLGKTLHVRNSAFRMLPNPTPYHWNRSNFNFHRLVREYRKNITVLGLDISHIAQLQNLVKDADILVKTVDFGTSEYSIPMLNTLHDILDRCDTFLLNMDRDFVQ